MMKCWEVSYCVWGNPAVTGQSGRVLRCQRFPPEDHPGAKEEQHLQCNKPKMSHWVTALMTWLKPGISDSHNKEQTEQQTLRSNLTYNLFNSALHVNSLEVLFAVICILPQARGHWRWRDCTCMNISTVWWILEDRKHTSMWATPWKHALGKKQTVFFIWSPDSLWKSGLVPRRSTVRHRRRFLLAGWIPVVWIQSCSRDTKSPIHDNLCY